MFNPFTKSGLIEEDLKQLIEAQKSLADPDLVASLANAASLLYWYLEDINWVGFYLWKSSEGELVLGPFQGLPACVRIRPGRGVCGTAYSTGITQLVDDVRQFPGHIACDAMSLSELVIPMFRNGSVFGVLDIDSPIKGRFSRKEADSLEIYSRKLVELLPAV